MRNKRSLKYKNLVSTIQRPTFSSFTHVSCGCMQICTNIQVETRRSESPNVLRRAASGGFSDFAPTFKSLKPARMHSNSERLRGHLVREKTHILSRAKVRCSLVSTG
jgi:hypothetical protein